MLVGYGIAALVVIVLLIVFNVRAARRPRRTGTGQGKEGGANGKPREPAADTRVTTEQTYRPKDAAVGDNGYRRALREFQTKHSAGGDSVSDARTTMSDTDYRAALRKQKSGHKQKE